MIIPGSGTGTSSTARWKSGPSLTTTPALHVFGSSVAPFVSAMVKCYLNLDKIFRRGRLSWQRDTLNINPILSMQRISI